MMEAPEMAGASAQRYAGRGPKFKRLPGALDQENSKIPANFQTLGDVALDMLERLRVARLRRRFSLDGATAALIADLAFSKTRRGH